MDAMGGERGIRGDVGGRWDVGEIASRDWIKGPVDAELASRSLRSLVLYDSVHVRSFD